MSILKYKGADGQFIAVNSYKVNNVIVSQQAGQSTADVMSQKAVTDGLAEKANASDVYTKTEADGKFLTEHQDISGLASKSEVTTSDNEIRQTIADNETAVTAALEKLRQSSGFDTNGDYNSPDYPSLADAIDDLASRMSAFESDEVIDGGEYAK